MGNEMGNSNVTGVQEQDSLGIDDANKQTQVSQLSSDKTVQEDKLLDLNLDHQKASKESNAAEGSDNSILQPTCQLNLDQKGSKESNTVEGSDDLVQHQTCQDTEEEEETSLTTNATVQAMEPSPTQSEDLISSEQEEAATAIVVEHSIQRTESKESNACSESSDTKEGGEESTYAVAKMPNCEDTELQDCEIADSSTGLTEKIKSGDDTKEGEDSVREGTELLDSLVADDMVREWNTVVENDSISVSGKNPDGQPEEEVENGLISAFGKSPVDELKEDSEKHERLAEIDADSSGIMIQSNNEQHQTETPIGFGAETKESRESDLDDVTESFYLEAIESEMRTVCSEANKEKTDFRPEAAPDRYYENVSEILVDGINEKGENGKLRLEILPQNGEEKQLEKNASEVASHDITQITEELEDESDMIEISGSLTDFVTSSPSQEKETEHVSDGAGNNAVKFPDTEESKGAEVCYSSSCLSDSAMDIDAEVSKEMQHSDTAIKVAEYTGGLTCLKEAQQHEILLTEEEERKPEGRISVCTKLKMEEEILANIPPPELFHELEDMESQKRDTERCLPNFPEEKQDNAENCELKQGTNPADKSEQAANSEVQSLKKEAEFHVIRCSGESDSVVDCQKRETEGMSSETHQENSETERISFDFQNPIPETRFSDVQSTKADFFRTRIIPQPVAVKSGTSGLNGRHTDEDELVTKVPIAETEVLIPRATKEETREEAAPSEESFSKCNGSAIKSTDSVKTKPQALKEGAPVAGSLQMHETAADGRSPDKKKIDATSPKMLRKQRSRSSLFSSCMCCTTVIQ